MSSIVMFGSHDPRHSRTPDIPNAASGIALFIAPASGGLSTPVAVDSVLEYEDRFNGDGGDALSQAIGDYFANGGQRAIVSPLGDTGADDAARHRSAVAAVGDMPFDLVCTPRDGNGDLQASTIAALLEECVARKAVLLLDTPEQWAADSSAALGLVTRGIEALRGAVGDEPLKNAAVYFPRFIANGRSGSRLAAPSAAVAGIISRVDRARGIWAAPAGVQAAVAGAIGLQVFPTDAESTALNLIGVNALRQFAGRGIVVWGGRTLAAAASSEPAFRYLSVRRLTLFVERSIEPWLDFATFESNAEPLWLRIHTDVGHFLQRLFTSGGLQGRTPNEAYYVRCGKGQTMTQDDIDNGRLNIEIGIAAVKPAEFVIVRIGRWLRPPDD